MTQRFIPLLNDTHAYKWTVDPGTGEVDVTIGDTSDPDEVTPGNPFVDVRNTFFEECQEGNYNFDTLRRAKHSTMMILHRLHGVHQRGTKRTIKDAQ